MDDVDSFVEQKLAELDADIVPDSRPSEASRLLSLNNEPFRSRKRKWRSSVLELAKRYKSGPVGLQSAPPPFVPSPSPLFRFGLTEEAYMLKFRDAFETAEFESSSLDENQLSEYLSSNYPQIFFYLRKSRFSDGFFHVPYQLSGFWWTKRFILREQPLRIEFDKDGSVLSDVIVHYMAKLYNPDDFELFLVCTRFLVYLNAWEKSVSTIPAGFFDEPQPQVCFYC